MSVSIQRKTSNRWIHHGRLDPHGVWGQVSNLAGCISGASAWYSRHGRRNYELIDLSTTETRRDAGSDMFGYKICFFPHIWRCYMGYIHGIWYRAKLTNSLSSPFPRASHSSISGQHIIDRQSTPSSTDSSIALTVSTPITTPDPRFRSPFIPYLLANLQVVYWHTGA
jgi:hypothetical protein